MSDKNKLLKIAIKNRLQHYISDYLTHWTGKDKSDELAFLNLKSIVESRKLYLNRCHHFSPNKNCEAFLKMVCFTDIPHYLSEEHCERYGKFGIVFRKVNLIKYGANPVLYITDKNRQAALNVYNFICASLNNSQIEEKLKSSFKSFFGYVQECNNPYTDKDLYYEREWRILENNLEFEQNSEICPGKKGNDNDQYFIRFSNDDIEFLICPNDHFLKVSRFSKYPIFVYEKYITPRFSNKSFQNTLTLR